MGMQWEHSLAIKKPILPIISHFKNIQKVSLIVIGDQFIIFNSWLSSINNCCSNCLFCWKPFHCNFCKENEGKKGKNYSDAKNTSNDNTNIPIISLNAHQWKTTFILSQNLTLLFQSNIERATKSIVIAEHVTSAPAAKTHT